MRSIRTKIMALVGGVAVLAMLISGLVTVSTVVKTVVRDEQTISGLTTETVTREIDQYFTKYVTMAQGMAASCGMRNLLESDVTREEFTQTAAFANSYSTLERIMRLDTKNILSAFIASAKTDIAFDGGEWIADPGYNLLEKSFWFTAPEDIERGYIITEPYQDVATGSMVITVSVPMYDSADKNIIGISGIDVAIDDISDMVVNKQTTYEGTKSHLILVSSDGVVVASENKDNLLKSVDSIGLNSEMVEEIKNPVGETIEFLDNGEKSFGAVRSTSATDWKVLLTIHEDEFMRVSNSARMNLILIYLVSAVILFLVIFIVARGIVAPLQKLTAVTDQLAAGNLETEVDIKSKDETGRLADSMRSLVTRLREYIDYIDEISGALDRFAGGHLEIELNQSYEGEFEKLKTALLQMSSVFRGTIGQIIETSERVASGSGEIANAAQMLAQGATNQASTTQELTATINELSETVSRNAANANNAANQAKQVGGAADLSNTQMREMITAIAEINEKSSEIGKIIKVIEDIAFQTNILALNAAVEAARAGEAGKGFAVVADEVRNLASKSAEAAKDTTRLIEETVKAVENGTGIANRTGEVLGEVIEGVTQTVGLINEISSASSDEAAALRQTLEGVEQISTVVQTNAATAEESSAASDELSNQANALQKVAAQFKI